MATVAETADHFSVDPSTVRRWIKQPGCPVVRRGRRGPGGGALLDLAAVAAWRGGPVSGPAGFSVDEVMQEIAAGCLATITEAHVDLRLDISKADAAAVVFLVFERIGLRFGRTYRTDEYPAAICALLPLL